MPLCQPIAPFWLSLGGAHLLYKLVGLPHISYYGAKVTRHLYLITSHLLSDVVYIVLTPLLVYSVQCVPWNHYCVLYPWIPHIASSKTYSQFNLLCSVSCWCISLTYPFVCFIAAPLIDLSLLFSFVTPLGLSCWHASLLYLYSALYDSCELIMCTTGSLNTHTGHFRNLDT